MPIVETTDDGEVVETNTKENAEKIVKRKKKSDAAKEKTPKGKKTTKVAKPAKTEPVEPINTEVNDQENQPGVPSKVGEGKESVETQPITQTGEETPSVSGVVQKGEEKLTDASKFNWDQAKDFSDDVLNEKIEETKIDLQNVTNEIERERLQNKIGFAESILEERSAAKAQEAAPVAELSGKTGELPTTEANPFEELAGASKLKGTAKTNAIKDLKQKYGPDYNRISKIDTNFARIVKTLEKNNLINKDC
jgi:hypothetical protein